MSKQQNTKKQQLRKEEVTKGFEKLQMNEGGPITFHYTVEETGKKGKIIKKSVSKKVVNISNKAIENRSLAEFVVLLRSMQSDYQADYFTF